MAERAAGRQEGDGVARGEDGRGGVPSRPAPPLPDGRRRTWPPECPVCVLVNPAAGDGSAVPRLLRAVRSVPDAALRLSRNAADTADLARAAEATGCRRLVVAGGDGTVHRVVAALREPATAPCLAPIPIGTGNDFARALGLPRDETEALSAAVEGPVRRVDLVTTRVAGEASRAVNCVVGGVGGDVARHVTGERKRRWRRLVYLRALLEELRGLRPHELVVEADGARVSGGSHLAVLVANGPRLGGGIRAAPGAELDDGLLDVVAVRGSSPRTAALLAVRLAAGRHLGSARVTRRRARVVEIRGGEGMRFNADGEALGAGSGVAQFRVSPGVLRVVATPSTV